MIIVRFVNILTVCIRFYRVLYEIQIHIMNIMIVFLYRLSFITVTSITVSCEIFDRCIIYFE